MKASTLLIQALRIRRRLLQKQPDSRDDYPDLPTCENALAELYYDRFLYRRVKAKDRQGKRIYISGLKEIRGCIERKYNKALEEIKRRGEKTADKKNRQRVNNAFSPSQLTNVDAATVLNNLGRLHDEFGEYQEAEKMFLAALKDLESRRGLDKIATIEKNLTKGIILNNLAVTLTKMGSFDEAQKRLKENLGVISETRKDIETQIHPIFKEYMKRCDDCEIQCKANQATLSAIQGKSLDEVPEVLIDFPKAIEIAHKAIEDAKDLGGPSEADYLRLLRRINNLAELYRRRAQTVKNIRQEEENALKQYKQAIDRFINWYDEEKKLCGTEMTHPHPLILPILENFDKFIEQSRTIKREKDDVASYEKKAAEIRERFPWWNKGKN